MSNLMDIYRFLYELDIYMKNYHLEIENKDIDLRKLKILSLKGHECVVFDYDVLNVIKVFRNKFVYTAKPDEKNIRSLMQYKTIRIRMPLDILYDSDNKMCGIMMKKIDNRKNLHDVTMDHFLDECYHVLEDVSYFSRNVVAVNDLHYNNAVYNGNINIVDTGLFFDYKVVPLEFYPVRMSPGSKLYYSELSDERKNLIFYTIETSNRNNINKFFCECIVMGINSKTMSKSSMKKIKDAIVYIDNLANILDTDNYLEAIEEDSNPNMTVSEYANKLLKKSRVGR